MAEKKDFVYVILAIVVVLVIALVIISAATGELPILRWPGNRRPSRSPRARGRARHHQVCNLRNHRRPGIGDEIPFFNCQVMDAEDPNRFVHIVTLNSPDFRGMKDKPDLRKEQWVKTFYEGHRDYYFVINARCIGAYHVKIQVPEGYIGT